jgi:flagellar motor protein MotB
VEGRRLATRGFGESKPVADNATAEGRQRNRRVEVIIEKGT